MKYVAKALENCFAPPVDADALPDLGPAFDTSAVSKTKITRPAFLKCYQVMENMRVRTKGEENPKATAAIVILEISQIFMVLCESCITIRAFLAES